MTKNRLSQETSPYLLQHKDNPVHWWAWNEAALAHAKKSGKPILLSVGYAACHWCHVMAHESFEDDKTAAVMNELFVNIKVDREERPDIDAIYMAALHETGEQGGWPLTMFLTPDAQPVWGGTYFPREQMHGRPGFINVMQEMSRLFAEESDKIEHNAKAIKSRLEEQAVHQDGPPITENIVSNLSERFTGAIDQTHGGIKTVPKFPQAIFFGFLWRAGLHYGQKPSTDAVKLTLTHICQGGIYDHVGGGFARYSTDERWLAPHFEKMLYDNALLVSLMTEVWKESRVDLLKNRIVETIDWIKREMIAPEGGFSSSLDADSEAVEGKFYVWQRHEIMGILGEEDGEKFCLAYDISVQGNWENTNIPNRLTDFLSHSPEDEADLKCFRKKLFEHRDKRIRPGLDDKVLADWNGLMITALVNAAKTFDTPDWLEMAKSAYGFVHANMQKNGRLRHAYRTGKLRGPATAADYANMIRAALSLHLATNETSYLDHAIHWTGVMENHYKAEEGGYYFTADDTNDVIVRMKTAADEATPNANPVMATNLMTLYLLTGDESHRTVAGRILTTFAKHTAQNLFSHAGMLTAAMDILLPTHIVIIDGEDMNKTIEFINHIKNLPLPGATVQLVGKNTSLPKHSPAAGKKAIDGKPTAYICRGQNCSLPVTEVDELASQLGQMKGKQD